MTDKVYLDASFVIPLLVKEHPYHTQGFVISKYLQQCDVYISPLLLDEVMYSLTKYRLTREYIAKTIKNNILTKSNVRVVNLDDTIEDLQNFLIYWKNSGLKPRDAMHMFIMRQNKVKKIATFDEDFIKNETRLKIKIVNQ
jgi:predicted nucleic acid-binding protein